MRYRQALKTMDTLAPDELFALFDRAAYTLGFSSLSTEPRELLDTEAAVAVLTYVLGLRELRLSRFVSVLVQWLQRHHQLLNASKLLKMGQMLEAEVANGELPIFRLVAYVLRRLDPKKFKGFDAKPLHASFYLEPRLKALVDRKAQDVGLFMGLEPSLGLMVTADAFRARESDLVSDRVLFQRNDQLRDRLLHGVNFRSDAIGLLKKRPDMSARELSDTLLLSYEPAHRLSSEFKRYRSLELDDDERGRV